MSERFLSNREAGRPTRYYSVVSRPGDFIKFNKTKKAPTGAPTPPPSLPPIANRKRETGLKRKQPAHRRSKTVGTHTTLLPSLEQSVQTEDRLTSFVQTDSFPGDKLPNSHDKAPSPGLEDYIRSLEGAASHPQKTLRVPTPYPPILVSSFQPMQQSVIEEGGAAAPEIEPNSLIRPASVKSGVDNVEADIDTTSLGSLSPSTSTNTLERIQGSGFSRISREKPPSAIRKQSKLLQLESAKDRLLTATVLPALEEDETEPESVGIFYAFLRDTFTYCLSHQSEIITLVGHLQDILTLREDDQIASTIPYPKELRQSVKNFFSLSSSLLPQQIKVIENLIELLQAIRGDIAVIKIGSNAAAARRVQLTQSPRCINLAYDASFTMNCLAEGQGPDNLFTPEFWAEHNEKFREFLHPPAATSPLNPATPSQSQKDTLAYVEHCLGTSRKSSMLKAIFDKFETNLSLYLSTKSQSSQLESQLRSFEDDIDYLPFNNTQRNIAKKITTRIQEAFQDPQKDFPLTALNSLEFLRKDPFMFLSEVEIAHIKINGLKWFHRARPANLILDKSSKLQITESVDGPIPSPGITLREANFELEREIKAKESEIQVQHTILKYHFQDQPDICSLLRLRYLKILRPPRPLATLAAVDTVFRQHLPDMASKAERLLRTHPYVVPVHIKVCDPALFFKDVPEGEGRMIAPALLPYPHAVNPEWSEDMELKLIAHLREFGLFNFHKTEVTASDGDAVAAKKRGMAAKIESELFKTRFGLMTAIIGLGTKNFPVTDAMFKDIAHLYVDLFGFDDDVDVECAFTEKPLVALIELIGNIFHGQVRSLDQYHLCGTDVPPAGSGKRKSQDPQLLKEVAKLPLARALRKLYGDIYNRNTNLQEDKTYQKFCEELDAYLKSVTREGEQINILDLLNFLADRSNQSGLFAAALFAIYMMGIDFSIATGISENAIGGKALDAMKFFCIAGSLINDLKLHKELKEVLKKGGDHLLNTVLTTYVQHEEDPTLQKILSALLEKYKGSNMTAQLKKTLKKIQEGKLDTVLASLKIRNEAKVTLAKRLEATLKKVLARADLSKFDSRNPAHFDAIKPLCGSNYVLLSFVKREDPSYEGLVEAIKATLEVLQKNTLSFLNIYDEVRSFSALKKLEIIYGTDFEKLHTWSKISPEERPQDIEDVNLVDLREFENLLNYLSLPPEVREKTRYVNQSSSKYMALCSLEKRTRHYNSKLDSSKQERDEKKLRCFNELNHLEGMMNIMYRWVAHWLWAEFSGRYKLAANDHPFDPQGDPITTSPSTAQEVNDYLTKVAAFKLDDQREEAERHAKIPLHFARVLKERSLA